MRTCSAFISDAWAAQTSFMRASARRSCADASVARSSASDTALLRLLELLFEAAELFQTRSFLRRRERCRRERRRVLGARHLERALQLSSAS